MSNNYTNTGPDSQEWLIDLDGTHQWVGQYLDNTADAGAKYRDYISDEPVAYMGGFKLFAHRLTTATQVIPADSDKIIPTGKVDWHQMTKMNRKSFIGMALHAKKGWLYGECHGFHYEHQLHDTHGRNFVMVGDYAFYYDDVIAVGAKP